MLLHIGFEWFEFALEEIIQHLFHTSRQQSQLIVFYLLLSIALYAAYRLWRALPGLYHRLRENLLTAGSVHKTRASLYWQDQSAIRKIKLITSCTAGITCLETGNLWLKSTTEKLDEFMRNSSVKGSDNFLAYANMMWTEIEKICVEVMNLSENRSVRVA
jgi:hypothetical protein